MISIRLPIVPVPFSRPGSNGKKRFNPQKYSKFRKQLSMLMHFHYCKREPMEGPIEVRVRFHLKKPKTSRNEYPVVKADLDNYLKGILDSGNLVLWNDDAQVIRVFAEKLYSKIPGIELNVIKIVLGGI